MHSILIVDFRHHLPITLLYSTNKSCAQSAEKFSFAKWQKMCMTQYLRPLFVYNDQANITLFTSTRGVYHMRILNSSSAAPVGTIFCIVRQCTITKMTITKTTMIKMTTMRLTTTRLKYYYVAAIL